MFFLPTEACFRAIARLSSPLWRERGQTLAEYGIIVGVIAVGVIVPATFIFRNALAGAFDAVIFCLETGC
jgi:Flp pilus assembly pilin Flp